MSKTATYQLVINGIQESVDAVESLNRQLEALESRVNALNKKSVSVSTGKSSSGGGGKSALSEEDKLLRQINQMEEKRAATQTQIYQSMLAEKDLLKEATQDAKQLAAAERLQVDTYSNTMAGMKQQLADIKSVMQTVDLGDTDEFDRLTTKANELNSKLKEIEQSYGQFGRNVGNYAEGVAEGMSRITIKVGETERTFSSAREASRTLNNELRAMALNGQQNTEEYHELNEAVKQVNSTLNDVGKSSVAMDNLLDTMQGFTALGSIGTGLSSFFGFDDDRIQQSIQKMVALQNVLQGIEQINLQIQSQEGIGKWLSKGSRAVDNFVDKLFGAKKATDEMAKAQEVAGQAAEGASAALKETAVAETAVATGAKTASVAAKALSVTLKTLGIGLVVAGIAAAVEGIQKLVGLITDWVKGDADLMSAEQILNTEIEIGNRNLERRLRLNEDRYKSGEISGIEKAIEDERAYGDALNDTKKSLEDLSKEIEDFGQIRSGDKGVTYLGGFDEGIKSFDDLIKRYELLSDAAKKGKGVVTDYIEGMGDLALTADDVKDELAHMEKMVGGNIVNAMMKFDTSTEKGRTALLRFINNWEQNGTKLEKSALLNLPTLLSKEYPEFAKQLEQYLKGVFDFTNRANAALSNLGSFSLSIAARGDKSIGLKAQLKGITDEWNDAVDKFKKGLITRAKFEEVQKNVMAALKETTKEAKAETNKTLNTVSNTTVKGVKNVGTRVTNQIQDNGKKEAEAVKKAEEWIREAQLNTMRDGLSKTIQQLEYERQRRIDEIKANGKKVEEATEAVNAEINKRIEQARKENAERQAALARDIDDDTVNAFIQQLEREVKINEEAIEQMLKTNQSLYIQQDNDESRTRSNAFRDEYTEMDAQLKKYRESVENTQKYITDLVNEQTETRKRLLTEEYEQAKKEAERAYADRVRQLNETYESGDELTAKLEQASKNLTHVLQNLEAEYGDAVSDLQSELNDNMVESTDEAVRNMLDIFEQGFGRISRLRDKLPEVFDNLGGLINVESTEFKIGHIMNQLKKLSYSLGEFTVETDNKFKKGLISPEVYDSTMKSISQLTEKVDEQKENLEEDLEKLPEDFLKQINQIVQYTLNGLNDFMSALDSIAEARYQRQIEAIDKENELLEEKLSKQAEITQKYADKIDDIENELADSRGDRRQFLIDSINAQMEAERASLAQEKEIEKQQEALDKKKEKLEKEERKRKKTAAIRQAVLNAIMAISNAAVNHYPIPAIPMIAMATAIGAAQVAAAKAAQYGEGGLLRGKSHKEGGIKVLGGAAEVEGNEYVIRKKTTMQNLPLLDYINRSEKKLNLSDFIDFYGNKVKNNISTTKKRIFADGGELPSLRTDISLENSVLQVMEQFANRPSVVSVVDIINAQDRVNSVKTLAGLT